MKKRGFTIRQKVILGFAAIILIFTAYGGYSTYTINKNAQSIKAAKEIVDPSLEAIKDLKLLVINSQKLTFVWIYSPPKGPTIEQDKQTLREIHNTRYPKLKERLQGLKKSWIDSTQSLAVDSIFVRVEDFLEDQKFVMNTLNTIDDYNASFITMNELVEAKLSPKANSLTDRLEKLEQEKNQEKDTLQASLITSFDALKQRTYVILVVLILIGISISFVITGNIVKPINYVNKLISTLGKGELPEARVKKFRKDEVGEIASSVDKLIIGLRSTSLFAENIGKGNYNAEFTPLSESDVLGNALIDMRNNLAKVAEEDRRRNWATEGLAQFGEVLRKNSDDIERLSDIIVSSLVKYVNANQGGLFIVRQDEEQDEESYLELSACYAWDKKKYLEQKVYLGDGLTGQAWQEQATIYLTEVPDDYVTITSGLGKANPDSVLIVPLKVNEEVFGVVEIASFNKFEPYEIEFVEKIAESIASTIATVKNAEQTQKLLEDSKMLTEQMRTQEEEMRQNMEELQATQEEMERAQALALEKENIFDASTVILNVNRKFFITEGNAKASELLYYSPSELDGLALNKLFYSEAKFEEIKLKLSRGEYWSGIVTIKNRGGEEILVKLSAGMLRENNDNSSSYMIILDDINEIKLLHA